jgi:hypothetical protein
MRLPTRRSGALLAGREAARYLCEVCPVEAVCATDGSGPQALVKVERPQRSEDVRP